MNLFRLAVAALIFSVPVADVSAETEDFCHGGDPVHLRYHNPNYGYSIAIPGGLTGCMPGAPNPNHGVAIPIAGKRIIYIDGSFANDAHEKPTATSEVRSLVDYEHGSNLVLSPAALGGDTATQARWNVGEQIDHIIEMLPPTGAPLTYSILLTTDSAHEQDDLKVFRTVAASFHHD